MKFERLITQVVLLIFAISTGICQAAINADRIAIGGITPYSKIGYVKGIYGNNPKSTTTSANAQKIAYDNWGVIGVQNNYGSAIDDYFVVFVYAEQSAPKNFTTPDGVAVGMNAITLTQIYGRADKTETPNKYDKNFVRYYYYANQNFPSEKNTRYLCFSVYKGKIQSIVCGGYSLSVKADPKVTLKELSPDWQKDFLACSGSMGTIFYVDTRSIKLESQNSSKCIISVNEFGVSTMSDTNIEKLKERTRTRKYMYDIQNKKMYIYAPNDKGDYGYKSRYERDYSSRKKKIDTTIDWSSDWKYIAPDVFYGEGVHPAETGELAFAVMFRKKFYNLEHIKNNFYDNL